MNDDNTRSRIVMFGGWNGEFLGIRGNRAGKIAQEGIA